jgi:hypothetical protein
MTNLVVYKPKPMPTLGADRLYLQQELANISNSIQVTAAAIKDDEATLASHTSTLASHTSTLASHTTSIATNTADIAARTVAPDTWHSFPYVNGWVDYSAPYSPSGYRKLTNGMVVLRGLCMNGTATTICTLPAGYRPGIQLLFGVQTNPNVMCRIDISPGGVISHTGGNAGWLSLAGITFLAEL